MSNLESKLKKTKLELAATKHLKSDLVTIEEAWNSIYAAATQAPNIVICATVQRDKALHDLVELQKVACGLVYEWVFNQGISWAGKNYDRQVPKLRPRIFQ